MRLSKEREAQIRQNYPAGACTCFAIDVNALLGEIDRLRASAEPVIMRPKAPASDNFETDTQRVQTMLVSTRAELVDSGCVLYTIAMEFCHVKPECSWAELANGSVNLAIVAIDAAMAGKPEGK